jgi:hypothetical protein
MIFVFIARDIETDNDEYRPISITPQSSVMLQNIIEYHKTILLLGFNSNKQPIIIIIITDIIKYF